MEVEKFLSCTLKMKMNTRERDHVYFIRMKLDDGTEKTNEITRDLMELILNNTDKLERGFRKAKTTVVSRRGHGYIRFQVDGYMNTQMWVRPVDTINNFNMSYSEFINFIKWKPLLEDFFTVVSRLMQ